jgi:hypothetical protein
MRRYRYRTVVLVGPWRDTEDEAVADAVRSNQARLDESGPAPIWLVPGEIESMTTEGPHGAPA